MEFRELDFAPATLESRAAESVEAMTTGVFHRSPAFSISEILLGKFRNGVVVLLGLALAIVPAGSVLGQSTQQQQEQQREEQQREQQQRDEQAREQQQREQQAREQQQREEQQREEQAREQQQREQQEREQQAREQQQREEQQREEQAREQQQREQQAREQQQREEQAREQQQREEQAREQQQREQQAREQQQREEQQREQQAREEQQRDQQLREEQQRNLQTTAIPAHNSTASEKSSINDPVSAISKNSESVSSKAKPGGDSPGQGDRTLRSEPQSQNQGRIGQSPDLQQRPCDKEPCPELGPKPGLRPLRPDANVKLCNNGPCPVCGPGQSPGKNNSCVPATAVKEAAVPPKPSAIPQVCAAGQIWNGIQCAPVGAQQCRAGETAVGTTCQPDCTIATAGAQGYIDLLRMARIDKDHACTQNPTGQECQQAELTYFTRLTEYRSFLGGVPGTCTLPDPISI